MNILHVFCALLLASYFVPVSTCPVAIAEPSDIFKVRDSRKIITDLHKIQKNHINSAVSSISNVNTHTNSVVLPITIIVLAVLFCLVFWPIL